MFMKDKPELRRKIYRSAQILAGLAIVWGIGQQNVELAVLAIGLLFGTEVPLHNMPESKGN